MISSLARRLLLFAAFLSLSCGVNTCSDSSAEAPKQPSSQEDRVRKEQPLPKRAVFNPSSRGPTGRWPAGFPAYSTAADIVTNGTTGGLASAIEDGACSSGCVIEHAGNVSIGDITSRAGSGEIVVRPPIGRRADFGITNANIRVDNLMFAGFRSGGSQIVQGGRNSGYAWIEGESGGYFMVLAYDGVVSDGFYYEIVLRQYANPGQSDRGGIRANKNGDATMLVVGSILTGTVDPPPAHADTLQVYYDSGAYGFITVRDSIVWPSYDKMFQGVSGELDISNSLFMSPGEANALWPGLKLGGFYWGGAGNVDSCTVLGAAYPVNKGKGVPTSNSELWKPDVYLDNGGNTILSARPAIPSVPTHAQLDATWSP